MKLKIFAGDILGAINASVITLPQALAFGVFFTMFMLFYQILHDFFRYNASKFSSKSAFSSLKKAHFLTEKRAFVNFCLHYFIGTRSLRFK